jgi:hypothetical protein
MEKHKQASELGSTNLGEVCHEGFFVLLNFSKLPLKNTQELVRAVFSNDMMETSILKHLVLCKQKSEWFTSFCSNLPNKLD